MEPDTTHPPISVSSQLCSLKNVRDSHPSLNGAFLGFTLTHSKMAVARHEDTGQLELTLLFSTPNKEAPHRSCPHCSQLLAKRASSDSSRHTH